MIIAFGTCQRKHQRSQAQSQVSRSDPIEIENVTAPEAKTVLCSKKQHPCLPFLCYNVKSVVFI